MPSTPVIMHQKTAPGPPVLTATATPTMLPVPTFAASETISDEKLLICPCPSLLLRRQYPIPFSK